jgi:lysyl-tRNA synthetase class 2
MLQDDFSELEKTRLEKIMRMRARGIEPYPTRAQRTATTTEAIRAYESAEASGSTEPVILHACWPLALDTQHGKAYFRAHRRLRRQSAVAF